jgi:3-dehydroquinate synthase
VITILLTARTIAARQSRRNRSRATSKEKVDHLTGISPGHFGPTLDLCRPHPEIFSPSRMISRNITLNYEHRALFTRDVFDPANSTLRKLIEDALDERERSKVLIFVDDGVLQGAGKLLEQISAYFEANADVLQLVAAPISVPGGEASKNQWDLVKKLWEAISDTGICRHSYVIGIGGGAVLDLVGFAASTAHRGVRHVRMPTTTLSQGDGGVGVKNGVNFFGKKNWVGSFSVPFAIINDLDFLKTLPERGRRAGIIEAIKVALIRDGEFFEAIEAKADQLANLEDDALEFVIRRSAELHMNHIALGGDPFELGSSRPLDFGHWAAHKLEQISEFRVGHGEAVAIGMGIDLLYAARTRQLDPEDAQRILNLIERIGFKLWDPDLRKSDGEQLLVLRGLEEFREHLGGELTVTLVTGIGHAVEVHEMDVAEILPVFDDLEARARRTEKQPVTDAKPIPAGQPA